MYMSDNNINTFTPILLIIFLKTTFKLYKNDLIPKILNNIFVNQNCKAPTISNSTSLQSALLVCLYNVQL